MKPVLALAAKDVRLLLRDKAGFFFAFVWPLVMAILFGMMFSGSGGTSALPVAVVGEDKTAESEALVRVLEEGDEVEVTRVGTREEAATLVRRGKRTAFLAIPAGYGESAGRMFWGDPPRLVLGLDPARRAEGGMLEGILTRRVMERKVKALTDPDAMSKQVAEARRALAAAGPAAPPGLADFLAGLDRWVQTPGALGSKGDGAGRAMNPLEIETSAVVAAHEGPPNSFSFTFPQGILWAILGAAASFGISLVSERTRGTLMRLVVAPIPRRDVLLGKALACFATTMAESAALMCLAVLAFGVRVGSVPLLVLALACASAAFSGLMMLLATAAKTESAAGGIGWAVLVVLSLFGGGMLPLFVMPPWMAAASLASPVRWGILAIEGAIWRDFSLAEMALPCGILLAVGVLGFWVGLRAFRWTDR